LIAKNRARLGKTLWTQLTGGERVRVRGVWDGEAEARLVADEIETWRTKGRAYNEAAVLVRAAWQMRAFEERFLMLKIPYKVIGGPRFFERAEVRDAHAYLRLIQSPDDDLAFERAVNQPKRGVGETSLARLAQIARAGGVSLWRAAQDALRTDELRGGARTGLAAFVSAIERWRQRAPGMSHVDLSEIVLDESGYTDMLKADKSPQAQTRLENLKELVQAMSQFDSLAAYLEHVSLVLDLEAGGDGEEVHLSTLHAAKGLEWPLVFLPGWEETVFPSQRAMDESGEKALEEERRLAYVGITRARESARISFAANRQIYGRWQSVLPSRFVDELPEPHVEAQSETGYGQSGTGGNRFEAFVPGAGFSSAYESPGWKRAQERRGQPRGSPPAIEGEARIIARSGEADAKFALGERVFHQKFGYGAITAIEGAKLTVAFEKAGEKRVIDAFVTPAANAK
jgi:DNA helicase-2/ATP-dependent DNA helicase PcrA